MNRGKRKTLKVNHITPHIGGGVGSVLSNFFKMSSSFGITNSLYCLDICKSNFSNFNSAKAKKEGISLGSKNWKRYKREISNCDVILIHYWNHPLMAKFLLEADFCRNQSVVWCHNSGLFEPQIIPRYLTRIAHKIIFTSSCSFSAPNLQDLIRLNPDQFVSIHSVCSLDKYSKLFRRKKYKKITKGNLLYLGTVSCAKMHPQSDQIFTKLSQLGFSINVVGGPDQCQLARNVRQIGGKINIFGEVKNVLPFYAKADLFIYPLRKDHYGTGEQVLLGAMAAGLPVIAFNNPAEHAILEDGAGTLVSKPVDFVHKTLKLFNNKKYGAKQIKKAHQRIKTEINSSIMVEKLVALLKQTAEHSADIQLRGKPFFLKTSLLELYALNSFFNGEKDLKKTKGKANTLYDTVLSKFKNLIRNEDSYKKWTSNTKSTPSQYLSHLPAHKGFMMLKKIENFLKSNQQFERYNVQIKEKYSRNLYK